MQRSKFYIFLLLIVCIQSLSNIAFGQLSEQTKLELKKLEQSAKEAEANEDAQKAAHFYNKAGLLCLENDLKKEAIVYFTNSAKYNSKLNDLKELKKIYSNLGLIYFNLEELEKSVFYFDKSLKVRKALNKKSEIASGMLDLAYVYSVLNKHNQTIAMAKEALILSQEINNSQLILICYRILADSYKEKKETKLANEYLDKYSTYNLDFQKKRTDEERQEEGIKSLAEIKIREAENRANLLEFELKEELSKMQEDSIKREKEKITDSLKLSRINEANQEARNRLLLQEAELKDAKLKEEETRRLAQRLYIFIGIGVFIFIVAIAIILFRSMRMAKKQKQNIEYKNKILQSAFTKLEENNNEIAKQKRDIESKNEELTSALEQIEEQNNNIESSINYATTIQNALLPDPTTLNKYFKDSFILFLPRDKVSGDFFWFNETEYYNAQNELKTKFFVSAIDCTGHGVPGALLSMIGFNSLENIVSIKKIVEPNLILHELHESVRHILHQETTDNKDGMDLAICAFDPEKNEIEYSGAKNPLVYIQNNEIFHIKGGKKPIGGGEFFELMKNFKYENTVIPIDKPTTFYIFSDGFPDQIGGPENRKYLISRFKELLLEIHTNPMKDQAELLKLILEQWRGEEKQIDDVIIIGFRLYPK